jgi:predicted MPP superfamily phosphohydrolase
MFKLSARGRGRGYSVWRGLIETAAAALTYKAWPARVLDHVPRATRVYEVRHEIAAGRGGRPPLRLAFASDLHIGPVTPPRLLDHAFDKLAAFAPDVLVLGGDYVFLEAHPAMAARLTALVASVPAATKLAVLGNHDLWTDHGLIVSALDAAGARVLVNRHATLPPPHDDVAVVGFDDPWCGDPDPKRAFEGVTAPVHVVVSHAPEGLPYMDGRTAALMLCGHTHGGQVALPTGPIVVYGEIGRKYHAGLFDVNGLRLYVSRGVGNVDLPLRLYAPSEVALFTIT